MGAGIVRLSSWLVVQSLITHLPAFETKLKRQKGLSPDPVLFVTRQQKNGKNQSKDVKSDKPNDRLSKCYGCGIEDHKISECKHPEKWLAHQGSGSDRDSANMATEPQ